MLMMATTTLGALCMVYSSLSRNNGDEEGFQFKVRVWHLFLCDNVTFFMSA